jgi:hypothetical protein
VKSPDLFGPRYIDRHYVGKRFIAARYSDTPRSDEEGPFDSQAASEIARYFRKYFLPDLPGADETEKLNLIFAKAPLWFLWFTHGDVIGTLLGLELPDLSSKSGFGRPSIAFTHLPNGPFEWQRLPDGAKDEFYATARDFPDNLTPRERMRALRVRQDKLKSQMGGAR